MDRHAQTQQLFIVLAAIIVIIATITIGVKLYGSLRHTGCEGLSATLMRDVGTAIDDNAVFGSRNQVRIRTSCDAMALCFVDNRSIGRADPRGIPGEYETLLPLIRSGTATNIYAKTPRGIEPVGYDTRIWLSPDRSVDVLCVKASGGGFTFNTRGLGQSIIIT